MPGAPGGDDRQARLDMMLRRLDRNGDGVISPSEVDGPMRGMYDNIVRRAGLDPGSPIAVSALREAMIRNAPRPGESGRGGPPSSAPGGPPGGPPGAQAPDGGKKDASAAGQSSMPGFGVGVKGSVPLGFGPPMATQTASSSGSPSGQTQAPPSGGKPNPNPSPSESEKAQVDARVRQYAENLLRQYDKNKDGVLDKDEASQLRGGLRDADRNGDGKITQDELTAKLVEFSQRDGGRSDSGRSSGGGSGGGSSTVTSVSGSSGRTSYRFLTPKERLPSGLPEWFSRKDADGDGQVSMAEYSRAWSDEMARDFSKYDLNGDGIVTAWECLKAKK